MHEITEIIPEDMPDWAREAMAKGQLWNECMSRIKTHEMEVEVSNIDWIMDVLGKRIKQIQNPWVSVDDRLPEVGQEVLCRGEESLISDDDQDDRFKIVHDLGQIEKEGYGLTMYGFTSAVYVTHWMPIPPLTGED